MDFQEEVEKMRSLAVQPPMLLDYRRRHLRFINNNGHIEDPKAEFKERRLYNVWTNIEERIFTEKYLLQPKDFSFIAQFLERKVSSTWLFEYDLRKVAGEYGVTP